MIVMDNSGKNTSEIFRGIAAGLKVSFVVPGADPFFDDVQGGGGLDAGYGEMGSDGGVSKVIQTGDHFVHRGRGDAEVAGDDVVVVEGAGFRFGEELPE